MSSIPWQFPERFRPAWYRNALIRRVRAWARRRQGRDPGTVTLTSRRTYILPTGVGLVFALTAFAMLLGSMNYNNNLSFVLTFMLVALGFVAMHQCHRNLVGVEVRYAGVQPVHAGRPVEFRFALHNRSRNARYQLQLYSDDAVSLVGDIRPAKAGNSVSSCRRTRAATGACRGSAYARPTRSSCSAPGPGCTWTCRPSCGRHRPAMRNRRRPR
ncbi:MAG: hypothetical protein U5K76_06790 [Woeseiaceae bacterium]|nr:hypothetical protein [Woeseiaceae bacterium]